MRSRRLLAKWTNYTFAIRLVSFSSISRRINIILKTVLLLARKTTHDAAQFIEFEFNLWIRFI